MPAESARQEWEEAATAVSRPSASPRHHRTLMADVDKVRDELRRRVGQTFTIDELARVYYDADAWMRDLVSSARDLPLVGAAAFHLHARGATDYTP